MTPLLDYALTQGIWLIVLGVFMCVLWVLGRYIETGRA